MDYSRVIRKVKEIDPEKLKRLAADMERAGMKGQRLEIRGDGITVDGHLWFLAPDVALTVAKILNRFIQDFFPDGKFKAPAKWKIWFWSKAGLFYVFNIAVLIIKII